MALGIVALSMCISIAAFAYRMAVPDVKTGAEAVELLHQSFECTPPDIWSDVAGWRNPLGYGFFKFANSNEAFIAFASTGSSERNLAEVGVLPDFDGDATWTLVSSEDILIRSQTVELLKYEGKVPTAAEPLLGWVVRFRGNDGYVKISVMGWQGFFEEDVVYRFLASIN